MPYTKTIKKVSTVITVLLAFTSGLVISTFIAGQVQAQTQCITDSFNNTSCRSSNGTVWRGTTDSFGNETYQDNQGTTIRGQTDSFGNKTYRDSQGNVTRCRTDSFGNQTCR